MAPAKLSPAKEPAAQKFGKSGEVMMRAARGYSDRGRAEKERHYV